MSYSSKIQLKPCVPATRTVRAVPGPAAGAGAALVTTTYVGPGRGVTVMKTAVGHVVAGGVRVAKATVPPMHASPTNTSSTRLALDHHGHVPLACIRRT